MVKYEPRTHRGSRDMIENVPCTIRVFNQTGAHTHYPTNIRLLTRSLPRENAISEGFWPSGSSRSPLPNCTQL